MPVELSYRFRKNRPADCSLLNQPVSLREPARIANGIVIIYSDGVNHSVAVEKVVAGGRVVHRIGSVAEVDAPNAVGYGSSDGEGVLCGLFGYGGEVTGDLDAGVGGFR